MDLVECRLIHPVVGEGEGTAERREVADHGARGGIVRGGPFGQGESVVVHADAFDARAGDGFGAEERPGEGREERAVAVELADGSLGARKIGREGSGEDELPRPDRPGHVRSVAEARSIRPPARRSGVARPEFLDCRVRRARDHRFRS